MDTLQTLKNYQLHYLQMLQSTYKRYIHYEIDFSSRLIGLIGARGVGKTTFLLQYLKEHPLPIEKKLYFSADAIELDSIFEIAYSFSQTGGKLLIIDEIHKYKNFEKELKKIYDMLDLHVIFSGSSALELDHAKGDLSRRAVIYHLKGLSFREFIELKTSSTFKHYTTDEIFQSHESIAYEITSQIKPFEFWREYLEYGYYPFYFENSAIYHIRLQETINTVIEVDIPSIFPIEYDKISNLKKLITLVCLSKPFKINIKELSSKVGIKDYQTLYRYLEYLKRGKILSLLRQKAKGDTIFTKPQKLYLANTNLHFAYCHKHEIGTLREVFFMSMFDETRIEVAKEGDFLLDGTYTVEVGGKNKTKKQIKNIPQSYIVVDDIEIGTTRTIPLWLFGFLY